jgi:hypothetical protein
MNQKFGSGMEHFLMVNARGVGRAIAAKATDEPGAPTKGSHAVTVSAQAWVQQRQCESVGFLVHMLPEEIHGKIGGET